MENFLIKAAKGDDFYAEYDDGLPLYCKDFDGNRFQVQLETLSEHCKELDIISVCVIAEVLKSQKLPHGGHQPSKIDFGDANDRINM